MILRHCLGQSRGADFAPLGIAGVVPCAAPSVGAAPLPPSLRCVVCGKDLPVCACYWWQDAAEHGIRGLLVHEGVDAATSVRFFGRVLA